MKCLLQLLLCCVPLLFLAAEEKKDDSKDKEAAKSESEKKEQSDHDRINGHWKVESSQRDGQASQARVGDVDTFDKNKVTIQSKELTKPIEAEFKLDPAKKPAEIDVVIKVDSSGLRWSGIYKLEGDTLTICWAQNEKDETRPTDFTSKQGDGRVLFVYKRVKEDEKKAAEKK